jgi:hypothetical protein
LQCQNNMKLVFVSLGMVLKQTDNVI